MMSNTCLPKTDATKLPAKKSPKIQTLEQPQCLLKPKFKRDADFVQIGFSGLGLLQSIKNKMANAWFTGSIVHPGLESDPLGNNGMKKSVGLLVAYVFFSCVANAQTENMPGTLASERLRNAQVLEQKTSNGTTFRAYKFAGSLQPNLDVDCVPIEQITNLANPPALLLAAKKCIKQSDYLKAWMFVQTANGFAYYDLKRLADRSTRGALSVSTMNTFGDLTDGQRQEIATKFKKFQTEPETVATYCTALQNIGHPMYEPKWAILHGIGAYEEPRKGDYLVNVDTAALWSEIVKTRCTPTVEGKS